MKLKRFKSLRGFSLVEILIVVVIISIGLLSLARFQGANLKETTDAKQRSKAVTIAEQQIEQLRNFTNTAALGANIADINLQPTEVLAQNAGDTTTYTRTTNVTDRSDGSKQVEITVTWVDQYGVTQSTTVTSVIASSEKPKATALTLSTTTTSGTASTTTTTTSGTPATTTTTTKATTTTTTKATTTTTTTKATTTTTTKATTTTTTTKDPNTVVVDTVTCSCSGGSNSSSTGYFSGSSLNTACSTCCSIGTSGGMGMMKPTIKMMGMGMGGSSASCTVYKSGMMTMM